MIANFCRNHRLVVVEGDESVIGGLSESQSELVNALFDKAFPGQGVQSL